MKYELDEISKGGNMKPSKSCEEERMKKKQEEEDLNEEMIRRLYIGSDSGG
jgi:hypothetical protein